MKKFIIELDRDGIKIEADGFKDMKCVEALDKLQKIIGGKTIWKQKKIFKKRTVRTVKGG